MRPFMITAMLCLMAINSASAAESILKIRTNLISCGPTVKAACKRDSRCCVLLGDHDEDELASNMSTPATGISTTDLITAHNDSVLSRDQNTRTYLLQ